MKWWGYLIFALATAILAPVSALLALANPFSGIFLESIPTPAVRFLGFEPPGGWSGIGPAMYFNFIWPLTLAPVHWLNYKVLRWNIWSYIGLLLVLNFVIACVVLVVNS
jgi:hypothetical protein